MRRWGGAVYKRVVGPRSFVAGVKFWCFDAVVEQVGRGDDLNADRCNRSWSGEDVPDIEDFRVDGDEV